LIKNSKLNWGNNIVDKTNALENSITEMLNNKYDQLIGVNHNLKNELNSLVNKDSINEKALFNILLNQKYKNYSLQLFRSD
jgi:hypothetical protein